MNKRFNGRKLLLAALALAFSGAALSAAPAQASVAAKIDIFHASCSAFSVDVTVTGVTDDLGGFDRFGFVVTDGAGNVVYRENSARQTGISDRAHVVNMLYQNAPQANPIHFSVVDLNIFDKPTGIISESTFSTSCLANAGSAPALRFVDLLPTGEIGILKVPTRLYTMPHGDPLNITLPAGREFTALYRTNDNGWLGIFVGGENLVWIAAPDMDINIGALNILPTRLDPNQQVTGAIIPGAPVAIGVASYTSRLRQLASTRSLTLAKIPFGTAVPVYGRTLSGWLLVSYNGIPGFVAARLIRLQGVTFTSLPVVQ